MTRQTPAETAQHALSLTPQLSAAVVAFTIEADNEFERRIPHITTSHGGIPGELWLTSLAMWFNCVRGLDDADGPITVAELERRARMPTNLDGMRRWGYITIDGVGRVRRGQPRPRGKLGSVLALTNRGQAAAQLWRPLPDEIEEVWRERFGADAVDRLHAALVAIAAQIDVELPDFMPIGWVYGVGLSRAAVPGATTSDRAVQVEPRAGSAGADDAGLPLISLLSRVLLALALDYEDGAKLALTVQLNCLRVLDGAAVAQRQLPSLTGVPKEAASGLVGRLERAGLAEIEPLPGGARGKQVRLTDRGAFAVTAGRRRLQRTIDGWRERFGSERIAELSAALHPIVGDGTRAGSPLFTGLEPYPDGWRADARQPDLLPWFPLVTHRGGFPDGS